MGYNEARALMNQAVPIDQRVCEHRGRPELGPCSGPRMEGSPRIELCLRAEAYERDEPLPRDEIAPGVWVLYSDDPADYIALCPAHHSKYDGHGIAPTTVAKRPYRRKPKPRPFTKLSEDGGA